MVGLKAVREKLPTPFVEGGRILVASGTEKQHQARAHRLSVLKLPGESFAMFSWELSRINLSSEVL